MLHYLRISVTAWSLTACMPLVALWVRSYRYCEGINCRFSRTMSLHASTDEGKLIFGVGRIRFVPENYWRTEAGLYEDDGGRVRTPTLLAGGILWTFHARIPYWLLALGTTTLTAIPWLPYRFSLRTLLIATTLVAVVLGIVVASS